MNQEQRRAYIDTSRRLQPLAELRRKASKAKRRCRLGTMEAADLSLREWHDRDRQAKIAYRADEKLNNWNTHFCGLCWRFGTGWNENTKTYAEPVRHVPRCIMHPVDDGPYPGWSAAGRLLDGVEHNGFPEQREVLAL